eukprot:scaffold19638_cov48-Attheya_sp.AAC.2
MHILCTGRSRHVPRSDHYFDAYFIQHRFAGWKIGNETMEEHSQRKKTQAPEGKIARSIHDS